MKHIAEQVFFGAIVELASLILSYLLKKKPRTAIIVFATGTFLAGFIAFSPTTSSTTNSPPTTIANNTAKPSPLRTMVPTATPLRVPTPFVSSFAACLQPCDGSNSTRNFPEAITKIYVQWDYGNIPYGSRYIRRWTMDGREWIKYDCIWTGNESGRDTLALTEPKGLHSGTWEVTISINGDVVLREQIFISGNWNYWDPAGTLHTCYGTTE